MAEPASSTAAGFVLWKFGSLKLIGFGAALIGAGIMAIFRPPKTKKELFLQGAVALAASFLFGPSAVKFADYYFSWVDLTHAKFEDVLQFNAMVHGLIGAIAWGVFGGIAVLRDRFGSDPIQTVKDVKDAV